MDDTQIELTELSNIDIVTLDEYFTNGYNATKAWMATHPDSQYHSARSSAARWLTRDNIKAEVERRFAEKHMTAEEAMERISEIARGDISQLMDISSVGFNLDMSKAHEKGLTKLIKKVKQKTTTYLAKSESQEDREVTELEIELYNAHEAARDVLKVHGKMDDKARRANVPDSGSITATPAALLSLLDEIEARKAAAVDKARAVEAVSYTVSDTRNETQADVG